MKSLRTCTAVAVATAFAHEHFADAIQYIGRGVRGIREEESTNVAELDSESILGVTQECVEKINTWRKKISDEAEEYAAIITSAEDNVAKTDLTEFFTDSKTCADLKAGNFEHINGTSNKIFVFSASMPATSRSAMTCQDAIEQWESGFRAFQGQYPPKYQDDTEVYKTNPNAVGLVALLHEDEQKIACGRPKGCTPQDTIVCYIKPSGITENTHPVTAAMWHQVEAYFKTKPALEMHGSGHQECLSAVNAVRTAQGLGLDAFTEQNSQAQKVRKTKSGPTKYDNFMYELTCEDIEESTIYPAAAEGYTIIYAVKEGAAAPTPAEAVEHWEGGFEKLNYTIPPAFKARTGSQGDTISKLRESAEEASQIYDDSSVAGYVSLMADGAREMHCYNATGCKKAAMVCVLKGPTLVDGSQPISKATWTKILNTKGITKPTFAARAESENCLQEINAVRTQESLGLKPFVAANNTEKSGSVTAVSSLMSGVTCETLKAASVKATNSETSLMYHSGSEGTCAEAVEAWKKGFEKFTEIPPVYNATAAIYQDGAATNFVSLMSEGENRQATCYTASGCTEKAVVCELSPAALKDGQKPISEAKWEKVSETMKANGATASFSAAALLSSAVLAVVAAALQL